MRNILERIFVLWALMNAQTVFCQINDSELIRRLVDQADQISAGNTGQTSTVDRPTNQKQAADLKNLLNEFNKLVLPPVEDEDYKFVAQIVALNFLAQDDSTSTTVNLILARETKRLLDLGKPISSFSVNTVFSSENDNDLTLQNVNELLYLVAGNHDQHSPYFCNKIRAVMDYNPKLHGEALTAACKQALRPFLKSITASHKVMTVKFKADDYGDWIETVFYVQSKEEPRQFLKITFDVLHEI